MFLRPHEFYIWILLVLLEGWLAVAKELEKASALHRHRP